MLLTVTHISHALSLAPCTKLWCDFTLPFLSLFIRVIRYYSQYSCYLFREKRQKPHKPRAAYRLRDFSLIFRAYLCFLARQDAGIRVKKLLEKLRILIINMFKIVV